MSVRSDSFSCSVFNFTNAESVHEVVEMYDGTLSGINYAKKIKYKEEDNNHKGFINGLYKNFSISLPSGLMFPAVRYSVPGLLVFERPPTNKLVEYISVPVDYINEESYERIQSYNLALPWQLYLAEYDPKTMLLTQVHMYFMKESLRDSNQIMYMPPLPNFYANGTLCRPLLANMEDIERYDKSLSGIMVSAYDWIWNSGFNHDLMECLMTVNLHKQNTLYDSNHQRTPISASWQRHMHPKDVAKILGDWEKYTLDNIISVNWPNLSITRLWDSEIEWFYENDPEYPFQGDEYYGSDCLEEFSENYPTRLYDLPKSLKIMISSILFNNYILTGHLHNIKASYPNRFSLYNKIVTNTDPESSF